MYYSLKPIKMKNSSVYPVKSTDFYLSVLQLIFNDIYYVFIGIGQFIYKVIIDIKTSLSSLLPVRIISVAGIVKTISIVFAILCLLIKIKNRRKLRKHIAYKIESMAYNFF